MDIHETKVYIALLIAAVILGIFLLFFIITIIRHQRHNQSMHKEKINAEITTLEKERARIASDLHDDLGPMLSAVKLLINNIELGSAEDRKTLAKANKHIDGILLQLRTISNDLMPQTLIRNGLVLAVEEFISEFNEQQQMQVAFRTAAGVSVTPDQGIHLYRIIREVIHNAGKHSGASAMEISLDGKGDLLILSLRDNGQGFDTRNAVVTQKGFGLKNILSRVERLQGNIYLQSAPARGTEYFIEIPITARS